MTDDEYEDDDTELDEDGDEDEEEAEASEELAQLLEIPGSIEEDIQRLKALQKKGKLQGEVLGAEIVSTVLPLLLSLANATTDFAASSELWSENVDETIDALLEESLAGGGGGGGVAGVTAEDLNLFGWLFVRFQDFLSAARQAPDMPEESRKPLDEIDAKLNQALDIVRRAINPEAADETSEKAQDRDSSGQEAPGRKDDA